MALTGPNVNISTVIQAVGGGDSGAIMTGDIIMSSGNNIKSDFSNATPASRTYFQTTTENSNTFVGFKPAGTATTTGISVENNSTTGNNAIGVLAVSATSVSVQSTVRGTGTLLPLNVLMATTKAIGVDTSANVTVGVASLATTATNGFPYIPTCAGIPTGVPTAITGYAPMVIDRTNNKMYFYSGGAWNALN